MPGETNILLAFSRITRPTSDRAAADAPASSFPSRTICFILRWGRKPISTRWGCSVAALSGRGLFSVLSPRGSAYGGCHSKKVLIYRVPAPHRDVALPSIPSIAAHKRRGGSQGESLMPRFASDSPSNHSENCPGTVLYRRGSSL